MQTSLLHISRVKNLKPVVLAVFIFESIYGLDEFFLIKPTLEESV